MLGDHIRALKGGKWVHGIDLGDQRVLHLAEDPGLPPGDRLRRVYRPEFTAGASTVQLVVHRERTYPARAVVARAWSRFMDPSVVAMFRDSESFAAWCKIGRVPEVSPAKAAVAAPAAAPAGAKAAPRRAAQASTSRAGPGAKAIPAARKAKARPTARKAKARPTARKAKARPAARKAAPKKRAPARKAPVRAKARPARKKGRR
jgi:hypothetical protein